MLSDWSKLMFYQSIKHRKVGFIVFRPLPLYHEANEEAFNCILRCDKTIRTFANTQEV